MGWREPRRRFLKSGEEQRPKVALGSEESLNSTSCSLGGIEPWGGDRIDSLHFRGSADSQGPQDVEGTSGGEVQGSRDLAHHGWEILTLT